MITALVFRVSSIAFSTVQVALNPTCRCPKGREHFCEEVKDVLPSAKAIATVPD